MGDLPWGMIEHLSRFIQENGPGIEEIQVQTLKRQPCMFVLLLAATLFVLRLSGPWRPETVTFLRVLGIGICFTLSFYITQAQSLAALDLTRPPPRRSGI